MHANPRPTSRDPEPRTQVRGRAPDQNVPSYYDVSILKSPVWKWEIATYFFLGGISAGAYTLARIAERAGGNKYRALSRTAAHVAFATVIPCAPLLIHDLGDPKRFLNMLRVFKPTSPMSLGTWMLTAYSGNVTAEVVRQYLRDRSPRAIDRSRVSKLMNGTLLAVHDASGVLTALGVMSYTGVLLSCTANPMWCKNPWLGPLFAASAFSNGAAAIQLAMEWRNSTADTGPLDVIDTVARGVEAITLAGYLNHAGERARPLTHGSQRKHLAVAIGSMLAGEAIKYLPVKKRSRRLTRVASSVATLIGGLSLRWAMVHGGVHAAKDPHLARLATNEKN